MNMRDIRLRMKSIGQTLQITSAMKLISTAKLRRARIQLTQTEPFFERIQRTMRDVLLHSEDLREGFFRPHDVKDRSLKRAYLVITSDKGLAGGFNHNIINLAESSFEKGVDNFLVLLGTIGSRHFITTNVPILETFRFSRGIPSVYDAKEIGDFVLKQYDMGIFDEFYVVFTHMYSSVKLVPKVIRLLPLDRKNFAGLDGGPDDAQVADSRMSYIPSPEAVLKMLVPKYLEGAIYGTMVENFTSEHCARMAAMDNATKNAEDMLADLSLTYNRLRQSAITQEVTEIVAGAAALGE
jgi:F-type H+-transporting ATPase subunit gamma